VIDSEWRENYLSFEELKRLLTFSESLNPELKIIITVSVRHFGSMRRIKKLMELARKYENLGLNLVAGNKVYLTAREQRRPAALLLTKALELATKRLEKAKIFVGTEGLINTVSKLASQYEITPFLLLDRNLKAEISKIKRKESKCSLAVYAPYLTFAEKKDSSDEVIDRLLNYALRRKWVQKTLTEKGYNPNHIRTLLQKKRENPDHKTYQQLKENLIDLIEKLSIFGDEHKISKTLQTLKEASIIVGFPIREEKRQVEDFARVIREFNFRENETINSIS